MKITGLITEYNPFHNGHQNHITRAREETGADYCVALMSGSFVQRGEPAIFDKYVRTSMALRGGADLVLEMPVSFSTASAMEFASFGVALFTALGAVDSICFGSECGEIGPLTRLASLFSEESPEFGPVLRQLLKQGMTYPEARASALEALSKNGDSDPCNASGAYGPSESPGLSPEEKAILTSPNNILGIEYIRACLNQKSPLSFHTIRREGSGYHDAGLPDACVFPSASAIRRFLESGYGREASAASTASSAPPVMENRPAPVYASSGRITSIPGRIASIPGRITSIPGELAPLIPEESLCELLGEVPVFPDDFSSLLNYRILSGGWSDIADLSPELEARLKKSALPPASFGERVLGLKSRQRTYTRVSRALLHLILDLRTGQVEQWKQEGYAPYARILGFRRESAPLLKELKKKSAIPLVTKMADAGKRLSPSALSMLEQESRAAHLYQMVKAEKGGEFRDEWRTGVVIV